MESEAIKSIRLQRMRSAVDERWDAGEAQGIAHEREADATGPRSPVQGW